jgi:hypothetical protein
MKHTKTEPKKNRSVDMRKAVKEVFVEEFRHIDDGELLFRRAQLINASTVGLLFKVDRSDLASEGLRGRLTLDPIMGTSVSFKFEMMGTKLEGEITRTKPLGKGSFIVAVDFRDDAPEYWREILVDILPE